jgi:hypothetical protein
MSLHGIKSFKNNLKIFFNSVQRFVSRCFVPLDMVFGHYVWVSKWGIEDVLDCFDMLPFHLITSLFFALTRLSNKRNLIIHSQTHDILDKDLPTNSCFYWAKIFQQSHILPGKYLKTNARPIGLDSSNKLMSN